jgi:dinuclear metal center YbgI/SA1388 family protein
MTERNEIVLFLNDLLQVNEFADYCVNGVQVEGKRDVRSVVFGVSASKRLFEAAIQQGADMIIVHHGLFWKSDPSPMQLTGTLRERVALLIKNDISLLGYHLPLDAHPELGNNAQILKRLNLERIAPVDVGFLGQLPRPASMEQFARIVEESLETTAQIFPYGPNLVQRVLVISGGSSQQYKTAAVIGADTFIGGDIRENIVRELEEVGLNFIHAGHYNTEKFGVQALVQVIASQFNIPCRFVDIPNPV